MNRKCTKDNKLLVCLLVIVMALSMVGGGLLVNWCSAIDEEQATEPSTTLVEEIVEPTEVETTEVVTEPTTTEKAEQNTSLSHEEIILRDTDLSTIDFIKLIDKSKSYEWYAYYLHSDGDIYVVTIRNNRVDVCCILN